MSSLQYHHFLNLALTNQRKCFIFEYTVSAAMVNAYDINLLKDF